MNHRQINKLFRVFHIFYVNFVSKYFQAKNIPLLWWSFYFTNRSAILPEKICICLSHFKLVTKTSSSRRMLNNLYFVFSLNGHFVHDFEPPNFGLCLLSVVLIHPKKIELAFYPPAKMISNWVEKLVKSV